jgi:hypothetical protein
MKDLSPGMYLVDGALSAYPVRIESYYANQHFFSSMTRKETLAKKSASRG